MNYTLESLSVICAIVNTIKCGIIFPYDASILNVAAGDIATGAGVPSNRRGVAAAARHMPAVAVTGAGQEHLDVSMCVSIKMVFCVLMCINVKKIYVVM